VKIPDPDPLHLILGNPCFGGVVFDLGRPSSISVLLRLHEGFLTGVDYQCDCKFRKLLRTSTTHAQETVVF
jgi:hypothetical protein